MLVVVADAGPIHYLVLIGEIDLLPTMFGRVSIPSIVLKELTRLKTPDTVRNWIAVAPDWLSVLPDPIPNDHAVLALLDDGERAAISLAIQLRADLVLMDDRVGVAAARAQGLQATGTIGLLDRAARNGLIDLAAAFAALGKTNFHSKPELTERLLAAWRKDRGE